MALGNMRELVKTLRDFDCHITIYPRITRVGILYKLSICLYGDKVEICGAISQEPSEFDKTAHFLLVAFHKRAEELGLVPVI